VGASVVRVEDPPSGESGYRSIVVTFIVDALAWHEGRIRYTCSICGSMDSAGPTSNPAVHNDMREHLQLNHSMKGTSGLRSETIFDSQGGISAVEFYRR